MILNVVTAPAMEPISLAEAKAHLRVDDQYDDVELNAMIVAARQAAENELRRTLISTVFDYYIDAWPTGIEIVLPAPPVTAVTSIKYYDENAVLQTWASTNYVADVISEPARIWLASGCVWPNLQDQRPNAIVIRMTAGYANDAAVPQAIRNWLLMQVGALYENRESVAQGAAAAQALPFVGGLLDPYRLRGF